MLSGVQAWRCCWWQLCGSVSGGSWTLKTVAAAAYGYFTEGPPYADTCTGHAHGEVDRHTL